MIGRIILVVASLAVVAPTAAGQPVPPPAPAPKAAPAPKVVGRPAPMLEELARLASDRALLDLDVGRIETEALASAEAALAQVERSAGMAFLSEQEVKRARTAVVRVRQDVGYDRAMTLLDRGKYEEAAAAFSEVIKQEGSRAEGAYYWKAYAQNRLGQRTEALATLDAMLKAFPSGRWASDARALQVEVKQASGQPVRPDQIADDEIKVIALNSLIHADPDQAIPMIESLIGSSASPRVKERALMVLAQNPSPRTREMLIAVAKGKGNPDLQAKAVEYLGLFGGAGGNAKLLAEIYRSTGDVEVKRRIIRALMVGGRSSYFVGSSGWAVPPIPPMPPAPPVPPVPPVAGVSAEEIKVAVERGMAEYERSRADYEKTRAEFEKTRAERDKTREAGMAEARATLWQLYQAETSVDLRREMIRGLGADRVMEVLRTEKNADLRASAIQGLGGTRDQKSSEALLQIYRDDKDPGVRRRILDALHSQQNAAALVQIARQETDPELKRRAVERLSTMKNKEATDYMMELLRK